jgi:5S rRNA maturation endonuclease (ribonuclease M5)
MINDFELLKQQIDLTSYITTDTGFSVRNVGSVLDLEKCPECGHKGCFRINPKTQTFTCYSCQIGGDVFEYVKIRHKLSTPFDALKKLATEKGYRLSKDTKPEAPERSRTKEILKSAAWYYHKHLQSNSEYKEKINNERGFDEIVIERFQVGLSGPDNNSLVTWLQKKGYTETEIIEAGIGKVRHGALADFFVPKLYTYPQKIAGQCFDISIKDAHKSGKDKNDVVDYRIPVKHLLRKNIFFNHDAMYYDTVFICEGKEDAISVMRGTGKENALAILGNPSAEAIEYLKGKLTGKMIYLAFDLDAGGYKYHKLFIRELAPVAQISVLDWRKPVGSNEFTKVDIEEYLRDHPVKINELIEAAPNGLRWYLHTIKDRPDIEKMTHQLSEVIDIIAQVDELRQLTALESIKQIFTHGPAIAKIIKEGLRKEKTRRPTPKNGTDLPYMRDGNQYVKKTNNGSDLLSNFIITIENIIILDDIINYKCRIINNHNEEAHDVIFTPEERVVVQKFNVKCASYGAFYFSGTSRDIIGIWQLEESQSQLDKLIYIQQYGYIQKKDLWLFENCAIKDGKISKIDEHDELIRVGNESFRSKDVIVYSGSRPYLNLTDEYTSTFTGKILDAFHGVMDSTPSGDRLSYNGYLFFGFIPALIYLREVVSAYRFFPYLFAYGPSNTGKTVLVQFLIHAFGFSATPESWRGATEPGTMQFIQQLSSLPCWYDEFSNDETFKRLFGLFKNIYNRSGTGKGGLKTRQTRAVNGAFFFSGEDNFSDEALLSRSVLFRFTSINPIKTKYYKLLEGNKDRLSLITRQLILDKTPEKASKFIRRIEELTRTIEQTSKKMDHRVAKNHAIPAAALELLGVDLPNDFYEYIVTHAEKHFAFKQTENPTYQFFNELVNLYTHSFEAFIRYDANTDILSFHFESVIMLMQRNLRSRGESLKIKPGSVKDYLRHIPGLHRERHTVRFKKLSMGGTEIDQKSCQAMQFKVGNMPEEFQVILQNIVIDTQDYNNGQILSPIEENQENLAW